jgi:hypothetical protein
VEKISDKCWQHPNDEAATKRQLEDLLYEAHRIARAALSTPEDEQEADEMPRWSEVKVPPGSGVMGRRRSAERERDDWQRQAVRAEVEAEQAESSLAAVREAVEELESRAARINPAFSRMAFGREAAYRAAASLLHKALSSTSEASRG